MFQSQADAPANIPKFFWLLPLFLLIFNTFERQHGKYLPITSLGIFLCIASILLASALARKGPSKIVSLFLITSTVVGAVTVVGTLYCAYCSHA